MPNIRHEVFIGAPVGKIYEALTTSQGLAAWWTPGTIAKTDAIFRFPFGDGYFKEMKITNQKPLETVEWLCLAGAEEWIGTTIAFRLEAGEKDILLASHHEIKDQLQQSPTNFGTIVMLHHDNWKSYSPLFAECNYTWGRFLGSLKLFCESGQGKPWPKQHFD